MEHNIPAPAYDHISVSNRARELRAQLVAKAARAFAARIARRWASLTHGKGHQPA